ncbi:hypothetical protein P171DRAFT_520923 [Karstenula rhodostoma CBS 690.94]|uniref:Uncharacterized protein n=1 Tax=Karstenula rhodostoma CBS 690.94 TaxID=1392251 RepID=A0A9P4PIZ1_9PLEO|nr:hypothetical protein P171DRAFT_520923 [Karstenula rhodostoma CBS 690.94]
MSSGTQANPIELFSSSEEESDFSDAETRVDTPPSGTKEDPITLASSEDESSPAPVSPWGSSKRPITLDDSDSEDEPPTKKRSPSPPRLDLALAIPATAQQPPPLLHHHPAAATTTTTADPGGNFVAPTIAKSARLAALLRACPSLHVAPAPLPAHEQIIHEMRLARNRMATETEGGAFLAWRSFAQPSRGTRECMVQSGLDPEDLWDEEFGVENMLPRWKQPLTSGWTLRGEAPMERRTPSLSREPSVFGEGGDEDEWVAVESENEEEVVVVEDEDDEDEVVILKVDGGDEGYEGDVEY